MSADVDPTKQPDEPKPTISDYQLRPLQELEEWLVINGAFAGQGWEYVRRAWAQDRDLTEKLLDEFFFAYLRNSNTIIVFKGTMGGGKSISALSVAKHLQMLIKEILGLEVKIYVTFSNDETFRLVPKLKRGDILVQDEDSRQSGEGSATVRSAIFNVQETVRANQNCFIFCSPVLKGFQNACHVLLEPFGIDYDNEVTRVKVYSAYTERPLGWALIKKFTDPELDDYYKMRKEKFVKSVIKSRGLSSVVYDIDTLREDAQKLVDRVHKEFGFADIEKQDLEVMIPFSGIVGNTSYQKNVIRYARRLLRNNERERRFETAKVIPKVSLENVTFDQGLFSAFVAAMRQFIPIHMPRLGKTKSDTRTECVQIYEYYLDNLDPRTIRKALGLKISEATISRRLVALDEFLREPKTSEKLGKLYEDVFSAYYRKQGHEVVQEGGSVPGGIDALVDGQVWSLKCYHDDKNHTLTIPLSEISKGELDYLKEHGGRLGVSLLNPFWKVESRIEVTLADLEAKQGVTFHKPN